MKKILLICLVLILLSITLIGCVPGNLNYENKPAGFLSGFWHGWISFITLIWSLFDKNINIYEINNSGFLYNLGFFIGLSSVGSSSATAIRRRK